MDIRVMGIDDGPRALPGEDLDLSFPMYNQSPSLWSAGVSPPCLWRAVDAPYKPGQNLAFFHAPFPLDLSWSEEAAEQYTLTDHPSVNHSGNDDLDLPLSDQSYSSLTRSDSSSHHSSRTYPYFSGTLPQDGEQGLDSTPEAHWHNIPTSYSTCVQDLSSFQSLDATAGPSDVHERQYESVPVAPNYIATTSCPLSQTPHLTAPLSALSSQHDLHSPPEYYGTSSGFFFVPPCNIPAPHSPSHSPQLPSTEEIEQQQPPDVGVSVLTRPYIPDALEQESFTMGLESCHDRGRGGDIDTHGSRGSVVERDRTYSSLRSSFLSYSQISAVVTSTSKPKRRRSSHTSSSVSSASMATTSDQDEEGGESDDFTPKRAWQRTTRNRKVKKSCTFAYSSDDVDGEEDACVQSSSGSPLDQKEHFNLGSMTRQGTRRFKGRVVSKKGKGKMRKISAADALAYAAARFSHCGGSSSGVGTGEETERDEDGDGEWVHLPFNSSVSMSGGRKKGTTPFPVPVPHLTKKSRGRKAPSINVRKVSDDEDEDEGEDDKEGDSVGRGGRVRSGRQGSEKNLGRSFVCKIAGCGKCFVRREHLKRHVRSIHTYEKRRVLCYQSR